MAQEIRRFGRARITLIMIGGCVLIASIGFFYIRIPSGKVTFTTTAIATTTDQVATTTASTTEPVFVVTHLFMPEEVRGVYFTSWAAGTPSYRKHMFDLFSSTTLNSVVIDVKDYSGRVAFPVDDEMIKGLGAAQNRIPDMKELIGQLHDKNIYVIGRVAVFQDPYMVKVKPTWAVHDKRTGALWHDSGGALWLDPSNKEVWEYVSRVAEEAYAVGFDEINFDYIRFPSDGAVSNAVFSKPATTTKARAITEFWSYLYDRFSVQGIPISVDIFGQVTSDPGDMGIGQHLESALPYFDAVAPMVYPSHYIRGYLGYDKPATRPYEVVKYEMDKAVARAIAASSSAAIFRPWLQAFDLGAIYTTAMVKAQIKAAADAGVNSWLLWNAGSMYKKEWVQ